MGDDSITNTWSVICCCSLDFCFFHLCLLIGKVSTTYHNSHVINDLNTTVRCMVIFTILIESIVWLNVFFLQLTDFVSRLRTIPFCRVNECEMITFNSANLIVCFMIKKSNVFFFFSRIFCSFSFSLEFCLCVIVCVRAFYAQVVGIFTHANDFQCKVLVFLYKSILHCEAINHRCKFQSMRAVTTSVAVKKKKIKSDHFCYTLFCSMLPWEMGTALWMLNSNRLWTKSAWNESKHLRRKKNAHTKTRRILNEKLKASSPIYWDGSGLSMAHIHNFSMSIFIYFYIQKCTPMSNLVVW